MTDRNKALKRLREFSMPINLHILDRMKKTKFDQVEKGWVVRQAVYNKEPKGYQGLAINLRDPN